MKLIKRNIDALPTPKQRHYVYDDELSGFALSILPTERKTFVAHYRVGGGRKGRQRRVTIGVFGKIYSGINILLLWSAAIEQGRPSHRWLTFKQALALGGSVRKGEKGTMVVYADTFISKAEQERATTSGEHARRVGFLKRFNVFHVDQCNGLPADPDAPPLPGRTDVLPHVEAVIAATKADFRVCGEMAFYSPSHDFIQVPPQEAYFEPINR